VLAARQIEKHFGGVSALRGVDVDLASGELLGLIGPNGSGKTTLVNCLSGVHLPDAGTVEFDGHDITRWSRSRRARAGISRTFQNLRLFEQLSVGENVEAGSFTGREEGGRDRTIQLLRGFGLTSRERSRATDLSYGLQRRVELARAVAGRPRVLLLDEPAAGLSDVEREEMQARLIEIRDRLGCAIVVIDHDMPFILGLCERLLVLHEGSLIYSGKPADAIVDAGVVEAYLGAGTGPDVA
jgi:branched-chain amino acid transport system ATP-binding protein